MASLARALNNPYPFLILALTVVLSFLIAWYRAGTILSISERVWRLIVGKGEITDPKLLKFNKEMKDIELFNFVYGLKVQSIEKMHQVIEWIEQHKLDYVDVRRAKKWIDIKTLVVQSPEKSNTRWTFVALIFCIALMSLSSIAMGSKSALLQFKESGVWFFLDQNEARGLRGNWTLKATQCDGSKKGVRLVAELTEDESNVICESFKDKGLADYLQKTVRTQRIFSGYIFLIALGFIYSIVKHRLGILAAERIKETLVSNKVNCVNET